MVVGDRFHGGSHIGYNRMNFRWGNIGTFQAAPGGHMWQVQTEYYNTCRCEQDGWKQGKPPCDGGIPFTMCFGLPPACTLIAGGGFDYVVLPRGADELGAAGAVQGYPVRIVKARTADAWAVADCEFVLEGKLHPRDKRFETASSLSFTVRANEIPLGAPEEPTGLLQTRRDRYQRCEDARAKFAN